MLKRGNFWKKVKQYLGNHQEVSKQNHMMLKRKITIDSIPL